MQVNLNSNLNLQNQPSFGMAKLTHKGEQAARRFVDELPEFLSQDVYVKKNILKNIIKSSEKGILDADELGKFFAQGSTQFADKNAQFVEKQILPTTGYSTIKRYLNTEHLRAQKGLLKNGKEPDELSLTKRGGVLFDAIKELFDKNIGNPEISSKKSRKMLSLIKNFMDPDDAAARIAVISDKIFSK